MFTRISTSAFLERWLHMYSITRPMKNITFDQWQQHIRAALRATERAIKKAEQAEIKRLQQRVNTFTKGGQP
jgi:hypothetical protein